MSGRDSVFGSLQSYPSPKPGVEHASYHCMKMCKWLRFVVKARHVVWMTELITTLVLLIWYKITGSGTAMLLVFTSLFTATVLIGGISTFIDQVQIDSWGTDEEDEIYDAS